jgi:L-ascorbate metabolism protein UlaG (beta-lactamase superfamily)
MEISFQWIGGATFVLKLGTLKIACDPVLCEKGTVQDYFWFRSERLEQPVYDDQTFQNIDLWLITHPHADHLDEKGLSEIDDQSMVICNPDSHKKLSKTGNRRLSVLRWNETTVLKLKGYTIEIQAIPAIHGVNPLSAYFAGKVNGYYLRISNDKKEEICIYITADTVFHNKIIRTLKNRKIDLLIPNMGAAKAGTWIMTLTLNAKMLQKLIAKLNPGTVIPVHYGTFEHYHEPIEKLKELHDKRMQLLQPGDSTIICPDKNYWLKNPN